MSTIDAFAIIYSGEENLLLKDLAVSRDMAALPIAGRYKAVDFTLSNLVNSGITNIGLIVQRNYHSLMGHLGSGTEWDLSRKREGLFVLPTFGTIDSSGGSSMIEALKDVMDYLERSRQKHVFFIANQPLYNTTYSRMLDFHMDIGADITILYSNEPDIPNTADGYGRVSLYINEENRICDMEISSIAPQTRAVSMDVLVCERELLINLVESSYSRHQRSTLVDVIMRRLGDVRVFGYEHSGAVKRIDTIDCYFDANMAFLDKECRDDLFTGQGEVFTKLKDEVPTHYGSYGSGKNSVIADGCLINGHVENSVLFRGVKIARGAVVTNSIVMQDSEVWEDSKLDYMILDKNVVITQGRTLMGSEGFPSIIRKGSRV